MTQGTEVETRGSVLHRIFGVEKPLIAMCHLHGLPGRPRHNVAGGMEAVVEALARDVDTLQDADVDGLLFCNENDIPYQLAVGPEIPSAMAAAIGRLRSMLRLPFGVTILWDPKATLAVARATGATFVREVFTGVYDSDMGLIAPSFGDLAGYRQALASSTPVENIRLISEVLHLERYLPVLVSGEAVARGKPAPDIFLKAAAELGVPPSHSLVIEDAVAGIQAARAAGMRCIAVAGERDLPGLRAADLVVRNLSEVDVARVNALFGL